jgi:hypothetical protein
MSRRVVTNEEFTLADNPNDTEVLGSRDKAIRDGITLLGEPKRVVWTRMDELAVEMFYMHLNRVDPGRWEPPVQPSWPVQVGDWIADVVWDAEYDPEAYDIFTGRQKEV